MSYEETLICDGCSRPVDGGRRQSTTKALVEDGGRAFKRLSTRRATFKEIPADEAHFGDRHLCGGCTGRTEFFDGKPVPAGGKDQ